MPGGGARGQNLGHLENVLFTYCFFFISKVHIITNTYRNVFLFGS